MKRRALFLTVLCLLLGALLLLPAAAETKLPERRIYDSADLLTSEEEARLESLAKEQADYGGCPIYVETYEVPAGASSYVSRYIGEDFLRDHGLSESDDLILLVVTLDDGVYYYDLYLYGDAWDRVNSKESDFILDADAVYDNLKGGRLEEGLSAFLTMSARGYRGRIGVSYWIIGVISLGIALAIGFGVCSGVYGRYKMKRKSVDYPLDQFARLELTEQDDVFKGSFVTKRVIQSDSGGSSRGGGSSHGGGRGHAGGR